MGGTRESPPKVVGGLTDLSVSQHRGTPEILGGSIISQNVPLVGDVKNCNFALLVGNDTPNCLFGFSVEQDHVPYHYLPPPEL